MFKHYLFVWVIINTMGINLKGEELFYSILTVFMTVGLVIIVKVFGNIPASVLGLGTDLNLLTYGFLWDTCINALRAKDFWERFPKNTGFLNKSVVLLLIFIANFLIMSLNFKLEAIVSKRTNSASGTSPSPAASGTPPSASGTSPSPAASGTPPSPIVTKWVLRPLVVVLGVFSLILFLFLNSAWS